MHRGTSWPRSQSSRCNRMNREEHGPSLLVRFSCRPTESIAESIESLFVLSKILAVPNLSVLRLLSFPRKRNSIVYFRWNIEFEPWNQGCRIGNVINEGHSRASVRKVNFFLSLSLSWNRETVYRNYIKRKRWKLRN